MEFGTITLKHKYKVLDEEEKKSKAKRDNKALKAAKKKNGQTDADCKEKIKKLYYSKIDTNYPNIVKEHLIGKVERKFGNQFFNDVKKIGVLNSYDGARHLLSMDRDVNVLSYSSTLFLKNFIKRNINQLNLLTYLLINKLFLIKK